LAPQGDIPTKKDIYDLLRQQTSSIIPHEMEGFEAAFNGNV
jgi:hypothetical protein